MLSDAYPHGKSDRKMHFARGMKRKLAIYESVYSKHQKELENVAQTTQTLIIDIQELIQDVKTRDAVFTDMMHITEQGAELYGNKIAESIRGRVSQILKIKEILYQ